RLLLRSPSRRSGPRGKQRAGELSTPSGPDGRSCATTNGPAQRGGAHRGCCLVEARAAKVPGPSARLTGSIISGLRQAYTSFFTFPTLTFVETDDEQENSFCTTVPGFSPRSAASLPLRDPSRGPSGWRLPPAVELHNRPI